VTSTKHEYVASAFRTRIIECSRLMALGRFLVAHIALALGSMSGENGQRIRMLACRVGSIRGNHAVGGGGVTKNVLVTRWSRQEVRKAFLQYCIQDQRLFLSSSY
jgi:hypothetical protein